jgi:hypothetical protein
MKTGIRCGWWLGVRLVGVLALAFPAVAGAHAIVLESSPVHDARLEAAPDRVVLRFNGRIERELSRATIESVGRAGNSRPIPLTISAGDAAATAPERLVIPLQPLAPGTYVLRYRVLAADGHLTEGALRFTVGASP